MFAKATPEKAVNFVRYAVSIGMFWPLEANATKKQRRLRKFYQILTFLAAFIVLLPLQYSIYLHVIAKEYRIVFDATLSMFSALHVIAQIAISFFLHDHMQYLTEDMATFFRIMKPHEREVYQRYVDKYAKFYAAAMAWNALTLTCLPILTFVVHDPFPTLSRFPFPVDYKPLWIALYAEQCYYISLSGCTLNSNSTAAVLMLFAAGKFEILAITVQNATTVDDLRNALEEYRAVRKFAEDVVYGVQFIVIATVIVSSVNIVCAGLNLLGSVPLAHKLQHAFMIGITLLEVYMCALPADVLIDASEAAIGSVYRAKWYDSDIKVQKTVLQMLIPQKPSVVSWRFVMVAMSLEYYCTYVSNAFSMFTALRVIVDDSSDTAPKQQSIISANYTCCNN